MRQSLERWATLPVILICLGLYVAIIVLVLNPAQAYLQAHSVGTPPIDLMMFVSPDDVYRELVALDHDGMQYYRRIEQTADVFYPLIYTAFFTFLWLFLLRRAVSERSVIQSLWYVPLLPITFDYLENLSIILMINLAPEKSRALALLCSAANTVKWALFFLTLALLATGLIMWVIKAVRRGKN